ncbi:unnamed protein product [Allacma fusca]|uniref:Uncharacterized protein n=1 Tax=Allacma fusca TaxID=39272 RepID=A0A8J2PE14_9HEXA|nr:unnamed protein product [Allacma fusca]
MGLFSVRDNDSGRVDVLVPFKNTRDLPTSHSWDDENDTYFAKSLESRVDRTALKETPIISLCEYLKYILLSANMGASYI